MTLNCPNQTNFLFETNKIDSNTIIVSTGKIGSTFIWETLNSHEDRCEYLFPITKTTYQNTEQAEKIFEDENIEKYIVIRNPNERLISSIHHQISYTIDCFGGILPTLHILNIEVDNEVELKLKRFHFEYTNGIITDDQLSSYLLSELPNVAYRIIDGLFNQIHPILNDWVSDIHFGNFYFGISNLLETLNVKNTYLLSLHKLTSFAEEKIKNFSITNNMNKSSYDKSKFNFGLLSPVSNYIYSLYLDLEKIGIYNLENKFSYW